MSIKCLVFPSVLFLFQSEVIIPVKVCQSLSKSVKVCQSLSKFVKFYQSLSKYVKVCQILSKSVKACQSLSKSLKVCLGTVGLQLYQSDESSKPLLEMRQLSLEINHFAMSTSFSQSSHCDI